MRQRIRLLFVVLGTTSLATPAFALSMTPDPVVPGGIVEVHLLSSVLGLPAGGTVLAGAVSPSDTTLVFELTPLTSGGETALGTPSGWYLAVTSGGSPGGADAVYTAVAVGSLPGGGTGASAGSVGGVGAGASAVFAGIGVGETTNPYFISFASLPAGSELWFGVASGLVFFPPEATLVPEPAAALLAALGLGAVLRRAR